MLLLLTLVDAGEAGEWQDCRRAGCGIRPEQVVRLELRNQKASRAACGDCRECYLVSLAGGHLAVEAKARALAVRASFE